MEQYIRETFKVFAFDIDTCTKTVLPLINGFIIDVLLHFKKRSIAAAPCLVHFQLEHCGFSC